MDDWQEGESWKLMAGLLALAMFSTGVFMTGLYTIFRVVARLVF